MFASEVRSTPDYDGDRDGFGYHSPTASVHLILIVGLVLGGVGGWLDQMICDKLLLAVQCTILGFENREDIGLVL